VKSVRFLNSLVTRMLLLLVMFSAAISIANITTQIRISREGTRERYASQVEIAVRLAASFISAEDIDFYLETLEADDKYDRLLDTLRSIQTISGMTYIFVTQITGDGDLFVFDTDPVADTHMALGSFSNWTESGIDPPMQIVLKAGKKPDPYISLTEWGYFLTAREPIYRHDGTTAGYAGANFYMGTVLEAQANSLRTNIIIIILLFVASLSAYFLIIYKLVYAPLKKLTVNVGRLSAGEVLSQVLVSRKDEFSILENTFADMSKRNAYSKKLTDVLNKTALIFLSQRNEAFSETMTAGVRLIADIAEIDRLILCRNYMADGNLYTSEVYRWDRSPGGSTESTEPLLNIPYKQLIPDWEAYFSDAKNINSSSKLLFEKANTAIQSFGVLTAAVLPIHINNAFWGFALFGNTEKERHFNDDIIEMLRSAAFLFANAFIRADMERDVKEALNKAMEANKAKSDFLSSMSHEIRTPMNAILGITEIQLENENISLEIQEAMKKIFNSGYLLLGIINDILDMSKIEAGKFELLPANYDVPKFINDTVQLIVIQYDKKPIDFNFQVDENIPLTLFGDELRIKQIINNLLSNAFKYTDKGEISMSVAAEDIRQGENPQITLVFRVADTGQGMTDEQIGTLFENYTRFNLEANRTIEGTGLGMSITKHLVNMMNGDIFVESEPGKGSVFTVRLPQRVVDSSVLGRELAEKIEQFNAGKVSQTKNTPQFVREYMPYGRVLIVDDVESNLYVARGLMAPYGLSIEIAVSGFEVIEMIKKGATYDIIFMDHFMPKMDGIETTKKLREMGYTHPIVALTANALIGQADMFLKNGFDGFISKPIDIRQLNSSLNKFIRDKYPAELVETARRQAAKINPKASAGGNVQPSPDSELSAIFTRDAEKALASIKSILFEGFNKKDDFTQYIIDTHSMKSALANIGENELSDAALKLELAGRSEKIPVITAKTPAFLKQLEDVIKRNKPKDGGVENAPVKENPEGLNAYLAEKLSVIRTACGKNDEANARKALFELNQKKWPNITNDLLDTIAEYLLGNKYEEAAKLIEDYETITGKRKNV
jgi:signal transduction histidine kinase/CheY-like chemotaxis protein/HPt (histidine-containing phosphotransfer) domain-containing protein